MITYDFNPYTNNLSTADCLMLFLKLTKERKEDMKVKYSQTNVKTL